MEIGAQILTFSVHDANSHFSLLKRAELGIGDAETPFIVGYHEFLRIICLVEDDLCNGCLFFPADKKVVVNELKGQILWCNWQFFHGFGGFRHIFNFIYFWVVYSS